MGQGTANVTGSLGPVGVHPILLDAGGSGEHHGEQEIASGAGTMVSKDSPEINARG